MTSVLLVLIAGCGGRGAAPPAVGGVVLPPHVADLSQAGVPTFAGCPVFTADNAWNLPIDEAPLDPRSADYIASIGPNAALKADFGTGYGMAVAVVDSSQPRAPIDFLYASESDPGPYPIPDDVPITVNPDHHAFVVDRDACLDYELYGLHRDSSGWHADAGALWRLRENWQRPDGWTSADAAGLPMLAGFARVDEVLDGEIRHALRFSAPVTQAGHVAPARHHVGTDTTATLPPMGLRVRLKSSVDVSTFPPQTRVVLRALQRYGMILADVGYAWRVSGLLDPAWDDTDIHALELLKGSDFEVVEAGPIQH